MSELDAFLVELNAVSAEAILPLFRATAGDQALENKGGARGWDPVTAADRGAEAALRKRIAARYPDHGVIGEEYGDDRPDAELVWVIDPIDGTRAFVAGLPVWTTLIGLRHAGRPVLGSIGQPYIGEIFIGHAGGARVIRGDTSAPLRVRPCASLSSATIATTDGAIYLDETEQRAWGELRGSAQNARLGCDAYAYAMVAAGWIDLVVESNLKAWDIDAAIPVVEGAGGLVTTWRGEPVGAHGGQVAIAGDRRCLDEALALLSRAAK
ncbi:MAG: histidinol-phosphatase [Labilithrix sp.]|nr:histidinol-phosphatase [Labilithrix sp.]